MKDIMTIGDLVIHHGRKAALIVLGEKAMVGKYEEAEKVINKYSKLWDELGLNIAERKDWTESREEKERSLIQEAFNFHQGEVGIFLSKRMNEEI